MTGISKTGLANGHKYFTETLAELKTQTRAELPKTAMNPTPENWPAKEQLLRLPLLGNQRSMTLVDMASRFTAYLCHEQKTAESGKSHQRSQMHNYTTVTMILASNMTALYPFSLCNSVLYQRLIQIHLTGGAQITFRLTAKGTEKHSQFFHFSRYHDQKVSCKVFPGVLCQARVSL